MTPTISVVLPVYNQEKYVAETLESVLAQTFQDFEVLVHDDGSTDGTAAILRRFAARDPRLRASFAPNAGKCTATNRLVEQARGRWCAFLDADDVMLPGRLEQQLAYHRVHPEVDATSCHCHYINEHGQHLGTQRYPGLRTAADGRQELAQGRFVHCAITGLMISRYAFEKSGGLRSEFWGTEDFEFFNRLVAQGFSLVIVQQVLMLYRIHAGAQTMQNPLRTFEMMDYTSRCLALRRAEQAEPSFAEFMAERQRSPWWVKLSRRRYGYSIILHRQAGFCLHTKEYVRFGWLLATSLLLSPNFVLAAVRKKLARRFLPSALPVS